VQVLGKGVYGLMLAARLTRLRPRRVREWFRGRTRTDVAATMFQSDYPSTDGTLSISFHDLIEAFVAGQLRERGVSLQRVRKVHAQLQTRWGTRHPFCRREILTSEDDNVFTYGLDDEGHREMVEVLSRQRVFPDILLPFLSKIDYDRTSDLAIRWRIAESVVIDPAICFGKPIVQEVGIATSVLAASYRANNQDAELVADWFRVHARHVLAAVDFERGLAA